MMAAAAWLGRMALQLGAAIFLLYALILFSVPYGPLLGVPLWIAGPWLITLLHEAGHALAARACGWRVIVFAVRPLAVRLPDRNIVFLGRRWHTRQSGWVLSVPDRPAVATRGRFAIIVAAGPVICLLLAVPLLAATTAPGRGAGLIACGFGVLALRSCLFSLLPSTHAGGTSDGQSLWRLWGDESWTTRRPQMWLGAMLNYNVQLRDLPRWMIDAVLAPVPTEESRMRYVATMEIGIVLDSLPVDVARARKLIDAYRACYGATEWLDSVDSYCAAIWEAEGKKAQATLWSGERSEEMRPMVLAAEAAVAARAGDVTTARSRLAAMRAAVKAESPFRNATFGNIGRQIESVLA